METKNIIKDCKLIIIEPNTVAWLLDCMWSDTVCKCPFEVRNNTVKTLCKEKSAGRYLSTEETSSLHKDAQKKTDTEVSATTKQKAMLKTILEKHALGFHGYWGSLINKKKKQAPLLNLSVIAFHY